MTTTAPEKKILTAEDRKYLAAFDYWLIKNKNGGIFSYPGYKSVRVEKR